MPTSFYREAFADDRAAAPPSVDRQASVPDQRHADRRDWCALFRDWNVGVGVSIDGPREMHDANRKTRSGAGTFDKTMAGIRLLRTEKRAVPRDLGAVARRPRRCPTKCWTSTSPKASTRSASTSRSRKASTSPQLFEARGAAPRYRAFLRRFWHAGAGERAGPSSCARSTTPSPRMFRPDGCRSRNIQSEPLAMLNVDSRGNVSSFSPELLGLKQADYGDYLLGNITIDSLARDPRGLPRSPMLRDIRAGDEACRPSCEYYSVCGGGAPVNKLFENGIFTSTATSYLHADPDGADRPDPGGLRPARANLGSTAIRPRSSQPIRQRRPKRPRCHRGCHDPIESFRARLP